MKRTIPDDFRRLVRLEGEPGQGHYDVRAILLLLSISVVSGCLCSDEVILEAESPGGRYVAAVIERNCGATTDYATLVRLRRKDAAFSSIFPSKDVASFDRSKVELRWMSNTELRIRHLPVRTYKLWSAWNNVAIEYQKVRWGDMGDH